MQLLGACPHQGVRLSLLSGVKEWDFPDHRTLYLFTLMSRAVVLQTLLPQAPEEAHLNHPRGHPDTWHPLLPPITAFSRAPVRGRRPERLGWGPGWGPCSEAMSHDATC